VALPILNNASLHELTVPSTGKTHSYRPYLVKEEKILLQAKESNDDRLMMKSLTKLIESCVEDINVNELTTFDVEYIFLQLRAKSSGEIIKVGYGCSHCEVSNDIEVNLANIKMTNESEDINNIKTIQLTPDVTIDLGYIQYNKMIDKMSHKKKKDETAEVFKMVKSSIISVNTQEERMIFADESLQDQDAFLDSLSSSQFKEITDFITNGPAVVYEDYIICTSCKEEFKIELRGMSSFF
jgi:hypothetical protein